MTTSFVCGHCNHWVTTGHQCAPMAEKQKARDEELRNAYNNGVGIAAAVVRIHRDDEELVDLILERRLKPPAAIPAQDSKPA